MNRRDFLKKAGILASAVPLAACAAKAQQETETETRSSNNQNVLKVVQQKHFIAGYDQWFDEEFVINWGEKNGVKVEVTHASFGDLFPIATGFVAMQTGCDVFAFPSPPMAFEDDVVDLSDIGKELENSFGPMLPQAKNCLYNPQTQKWTGISDHWVPLVTNWRSDLWEEVEPGSSPQTWDDILRVGRKLKRLGHPIGLGMSTDLDSNIALNGLLNAYGSVIQDEKGLVTVNSAETVAALTLGAALYKETMQPEILAWNASSNNQFLLGSKGSFAMNAVSVTRVAEKNDPDLAKVIALSPPPAGPVQRMTPANVVSVYTVWKFSKQIDLAKQFIKDLILAAETAFQKGELYNYPSFPGAVKNLEAAYDKEPKYAFLKTAPEWVCNVGYPGNANAVTNEIFDNYLVPKAFSLVAIGTLTPEEGSLWLEKEVNKLVARWNVRNIANNS
ncbi:MAG: hypothetical protein CL609_16840 [Anaerolineaceae bacterium]|nr:hypothetical protein [Anaerolineaceae bacterium]